MLQYYDRTDHPTTDFRNSPTVVNVNQASPCERDRGPNHYGMSAVGRLGSECTEQREKHADGLKAKGPQNDPVNVPRTRRS
jgi:hypothetical protein